MPFLTHFVLGCSYTLIALVTLALVKLPISAFSVCLPMNINVLLHSAADIKKRWQEYTEELYKRDLHDPDNHDDVIIHLEPHILECEVKLALRSITMNKASRGDGISVELFQILKDDAVIMLHLNMPENLENSAVATGLEKVRCNSNTKERQCQRTLSCCCC